MVRSNIGLFCLLFLLSSCTSRIHVSGKGCSGQLEWNTIEREFSPSLGDKFATDVTYQKQFFDLVAVERIWTPLGQISREKLLLKDLLRLNGLQCSQVQRIEMTYFNDYVDIISSVIPFLSSRSVMLKIHLKR